MGTFFNVKDQTVNISGFAAHRVFVAYSFFYKPWKIYKLFLA